MLKVHLRPKHNNVHPNVVSQYVTVPLARETKK